MMRLLIIRATMVPIEDATSAFSEKPGLLIRAEATRLGTTVRRFGSDAGGIPSIVTTVEANLSSAAELTFAELSGESALMADA